LGLFYRKALPPPQSILITAAAGGMGRALALAYAAPGVHLFLSDVEGGPRLDNLAEACRERGALVDCDEVDVTHRQHLAEWIFAAERVRSLDLVIALAGLSRGTIPQEETPEEARHVFAVNLDGMLNTVEPALSLFRPRRRGQIALMSSLAGFRGLPVAPSYCATKAATRVYGEGLRARLRREGVWVSVILPGFVKTHMTAANTYHMPLAVDAKRAAAIIKRGLAKGKARISFPGPMALGGHLLSSLPPSWLDWFVTLK